MCSKFVHLHTHSHYSLLDGLSKVDELVKKAKEFDMPALAITDHGNMYAAIDFYKQCQEAGVKPIIGVEGYLAARGRFDKEPSVDSKRYHITLLAKNLTGYKNLMKLVTKSHLEGFYYKPRMDKEILREHHEGIICLSGCPAGELANALRAKNMTKAEALVEEYMDIFGKENYFLELMGHDEVEGHTEVKNGLKILSKKYDIPIVATWDSHYLHFDDADAQDTLIAINTGSDVASKEMTMKGGNYSFVNEEQIRKYFSDTPEAVENTLLVAEKINLELELGKWVFPDIETLPGKNHTETLREYAFTGLERRGFKDNANAIERLEYELGIIDKKGYSPYFLVVADLVRFAKENGILSAIRGSVAGSITTYSLGITSVDPLKYQIPFERFLNPERPSAPDIDMDFADNRRDEMIEYAKRKYGEDKVAQIGTFGTMAARGAVRDVARALGYPYSTGDRISKMIPMGSQGFPMTIDRALEMVEELQEAYDNERDTKTIIDMAKKLEGSARHISVHAAGVVISPVALTEYVPLQYDPKGGKIITQYDMHAVEDAGLLKFDFLGIKNLAILADAVIRVKKQYGIDIDLENIDIANRKTFELLARGDTEGLFQLNGSGMTRYLKELKPSSITDINAMVALYRPGPMQFIPLYIERKHNPRLIKYMDPALEPILKQTYGILVYQDDLLLMAVNLAGYSWGEVDKFRKAVGKKIPEEMAKQKEKFINGCVSYSKWPLKKAEELWNWIEPFAAYGFNKAHAASYGKVAYQTAYMKANFPVEYMASILTAESGDIEKISIIINECKNMKIPVSAPSVNISYGDFTVVYNEEKKPTNILFGFHSIKNLGNEIADAIITEREKDGDFASIGDFLTRVKHKNLNKKSLEALVKSGSLDCLGNRSAMLSQIEEMLAFAKQSKNENENQQSLFGLLEINSAPSFKLIDAPEIDELQRLASEKELLGLYISGHPLDKHTERIRGKVKDIKSILENGKNGLPVVIAGVIETVRINLTKKNDRMAFVKIGDQTSQIEVVIFPKVFVTSHESVEEGAVVAISGKISIRNDEKSILVDK
ncbi:MAG: DNA polymerase III subunit alpha, partial [Candidatus Pacebacteria bacterium]|nr:DNA polymerase III subunit alpha [Candidatus Paceibacterota bacterium]